MSLGGVVGIEEDSMVLLWEERLVGLFVNVILAGNMGRKVFDDILKIQKLGKECFVGWFLISGSDWGSMWVKWPMDDSNSFRWLLPATIFIHLIHNYYVRLLISDLSLEK